jgi:hypothetical protein
MSEGNAHRAAVAGKDAQASPDLAAQRRMQPPAAAARFDLQRGLANMLGACTAATKEDRVLIVTDDANTILTGFMRERLERIGAEVKVMVMESIGRRPLTSLPKDAEAEIRGFGPTLTFFAAAGMQDGELGFRSGLIHLVTDKPEKGGLFGRDAHMPSINLEVAGGEAMCADYKEVVRQTHAVHEAVKNAQNIVVASPNGTHLEMEFGPKTDWDPCDGIVQDSGVIKNVPDGEVYTCPASVNGTLVANLLGDHFVRMGVLETPVEIIIEGGRAVAVQCENDALEAEVWAYLKRGENTDRVGECGIGTNTNVKNPMGNMLNDEKKPGVHIAFGSNLGMAAWKVIPDQHCDMLIPECTIVVDGRAIMQDGKFLI